MAVDPYTVLDVKKDASQDDIQKAYRRLAKKLHPDLNPGNKRAEEQFKEVSAAYDLLGDPDKRARFDRGEIDDRVSSSRTTASIATSLTAAVPITLTTPVLPTSPPTMIFFRRFSAATAASACAAPTCTIALSSTSSTPSTAASGRSHCPTVGA